MGGRFSPPQWFRFSLFGQKLILSQMFLLLKHLISMFSNKLVISESVLYFSFPEGTGIFQDDNDKIKQAKIVKEWFREHKTSF